MKLFYSRNYIAPVHAFDTTRKAGWIVESLYDRPIAGVEIVAPKPLTVAELNQVHDLDYIRAVRTGKPAGAASSQGFPWDPGIWRMARATNGGAVEAALAALEAEESHVAGSLSAGLHHAKWGHGSGFCTFNGLALAAKAALAAGARDVMILDLDAHCGGGTHSLVHNDYRIRHVDISVNGFDTFESTKRSRSVVVTERSQYLRVIRETLAELPRFDLCLYNAGMDTHGYVTIATLAARELAVFKWARETRTPIAFVLAGGYTGPDLSQAELVDLHRLTIEAAALSEAQR